VPLAVEKLDGKSKIVATKIVVSLQALPRFYRIAEVHFPSCKLWKRALHRKAGKKHAAKRRTLSGKACASRFQI